MEALSQSCEKAVAFGRITGFKWPEMNIHQTLAFYADDITLLLEASLENICTTTALFPLPKTLSNLVGPGKLDLPRQNSSASSLATDCHRI